MSEALTARLAELAARGETVSYGALAREMGWRMGELTAALEQLMEIDAAAAQPMRAVVCAARLGDGRPAPGFFAKLAELGLLVEDPAGFVRAERAALHRVFAATDRP